MYRTLHPKIAAYRFLSSAHGTFFKIDYMLNYKTSLKFNKTEIIQSIFSNHSGIKQEINSVRKIKENLQKCENQHSHKQPMVQGRNHKGILKISGDK